MSKKYVNPSGFTENLPREQVVEDRYKNVIRKIAESYGYSHLETASVEYMDTLSSKKGEVDKEIYSIGRAKAESDVKTDEPDRGLHFDLTVPFARYVAQHQGELSFPYRRYQIQKVWRGERPQKGRFREFYQADIDVVALNKLPLAFDAEVATVMAHVLEDLSLGKVTMSINNRKFLNGIFEMYGIVDTQRALQIVDKLDKIGEVKIKLMLSEDLSVSSDTVDKLFAIISKKIDLEMIDTFFNSIPDHNESIVCGKLELKSVFDLLSKNKDLFKNVSFICNPSIARGLDYYTGTVFETTIDGLEKYGSICSGGRYADLAARFTNQKLPGVGMSIGLTRLLTVVKEENLLKYTKYSNTDVAICLLHQELLDTVLEKATLLRKSGINVQVNYREDLSLGKQLEQAKNAGIPLAVVCEADGTITLFDVESQSKKTYLDISTLTEYLLKQKQINQSQE